MATTRSMICVPILRDSVEHALADATEARHRGADIVEFRIDTLCPAPHDAHLAIDAVARSPLPCIVTCRPEWEGGEHTGTDDQRAAIMSAVADAEAPPAYIDLELAAIQRSPAMLELAARLDARQTASPSTSPPRPRLIVSSHDFQGRPADLHRRLLAMRQTPGCHVCKIAFRARSIRDNLEILDILAERDRPTIALAMGEAGVMSRVLAPKAGGLLTFASLRDTSATAPGQPTISELRDLYRIHRIGHTTRVYGIVGWPVAHSLSPTIHNAVFEALSFDGVYVHLPVPTGDDGAAGFENLKATLTSLVDHPALGFAGCSVTIPHKQNLVRLARELAWDIPPAVNAIGAANTLIVDRDSAGAPARCRLLNTDAQAAADALEERLDLAAPRSLRNADVLIAGTGGAARAIAVELASRGAGVFIQSRSVDRARAFCDELASAIEHAGGQPPQPVSPNPSPDDPIPAALINATPAGMTGGPEPDAVPFDLNRWAAGTRHIPTTSGGDNRSDGAKISTPLVFDTVYAPPLTPLLREARERGLDTLEGTDMFVRQAALQSRAWTGQDAPTGLLFRILRERHT